ESFIFSGGYLSFNHLLLDDNENKLLIDFEVYANEEKQTLLQYKDENDDGFSITLQENENETHQIQLVTLSSGSESIHTLSSPIDTGERYRLTLSKVVDD